MTHPALALRTAIEGLRAELRARYDVLVDDTTWSWRDGAVQVEGSVLVAAQADAYQKAVRDALPELDVQVPRPVILSDLGAPFAYQSWAPLQGTGPIDLHGRPEGDDLQTQWSERTMLRVFLRAPGQARALVQLPDGTVGWVDAGRLGMGGTQPSADPWRRYVRAVPGVALLTAPGTLAVITSAARKRLGRPYLWGGNTNEAADCSGFIQGVVRDGADVLLPKNTKDQLRCGERVAKDAIRVGDVVFVKGREKNILHVGIALQAIDGGVSVIHSCLSREVVLEESLAEFLERYRFVGARRFFVYPELDGGTS